MNKEVMKQALEALEMCAVYAYAEGIMQRKHTAAIEALTEAIAQPAVTEGYRAVSVMELINWRARVNTTAALTLKADRYQVGGRLKQSITDTIEGVAS